MSSFAVYHSFKMMRQLVVFSRFPILAATGFLAVLAIAFGVGGVAIAVGVRLSGAIALEYGDTLVGAIAHSANISRSQRLFNRREKNGLNKWKVSLNSMTQEL